MLWFIINFILFETGGRYMTVVKIKILLKNKKYWTHHKDLSKVMCPTFY